MELGCLLHFLDTTSLIQSIPGRRPGKLEETWIPGARRGGCSRPRRPSPACPTRSRVPETAIQGCRQDTVWRSAWTAQARCCAAVYFMVAPAGCSTSQTTRWGLQGYGRVLAYFLGSAGVRPRPDWRCFRAMGGFFHFLDQFSHPFYNSFMPGDHTTIILQSIHEEQ